MNYIGPNVGITEIPECNFCQPLYREFGESFVYLVNSCSNLVYITCRD
jgi:hypothetical protein